VSSAYCVNHGHVQVGKHGCEQCHAAVSVRCEQCGTLTTIELVIRTRQGEAKVCPGCWRSQ